MRDRQALIMAALLLALFLLPTCAQADNPRRPKLYLIVCDSLTFEDLHIGTPTNPHLAEMAARGAAGLMNCSTALPRSDTSGLLAMATGRIVPGQYSDELAANDWEKAPGERISAADSHRARLGMKPLPAYVSDPRNSVKHLGIQDLKARGLDSDRLGALLQSANPPVRTWIVGNADTSGWRRRAALLTVDKLGVGSGMVALRSYDPRLPYGLTDNPSAIVDYATQTDADFIVIHLGNGARAEAARPHLSAAEYQAAHNEAVGLLDEVVKQLSERVKAASTDILVVAPRPPSADATHPNDWNRLTPILGVGPDLPAGTFVSATTRSPGLVAEIDIAPTILSLYHLPVPPTMIGRPLHIDRDVNNQMQGAKRLAHLGHIDFVAWANAAGLAPFLCVLGAICFLCCVLGAIAIRYGGVRAAGVFAAGLVFAMNFTAAQLFAPILVRPSLIEYGLTIAAWMIALTVICYAIARVLRISVPVAACGINVGAILIDLVTGQHLLKDALISNYYLPGFRFYGIGNDFLGLVFGAAIAGGFSLLDDLEARRANRRHVEGKELPERSGEPASCAAYFVLLIWLVTAVVLGAPWWGANSGSLIISTVAFGTGWLVLRRSRKIWLFASGFAIAGIGIAFAFAYMDARFHGAQSSHAGAALQRAAAERGAAYLWDIVVRKVRFNIGMLSAPWTWVTASACAGALLLAPILVEREIEETKQRRPWLARSLPVIVSASITALLFKDTGVVTVCYLISVSIIVGFYYMLVPRLPQLQSQRN